MLKIGDFSRLAQVSIKTLRYYDVTGLLKPDHVDRFTGYRYYAPSQLHRLNRILVLKDLGLSLEQIAAMLDHDLSAETMRGMLRLKQSELRAQIDEAAARLTRLEIRLNQIDREDNMPEYEVVVKRIEAQRALCLRRMVPSVEAMRRLLDMVNAGVRRHSGIRASSPWLVQYHHAGYRDYDIDMEIVVTTDPTAPERLVLADGSQMTARTLPAIEHAVTALLSAGETDPGGVYAALNTYLQAHQLTYRGPAREIYVAAPPNRLTLVEIQYPTGAIRPEKPADGMELPADWQVMPRLPLSRRARTAVELARIEAIALDEPEIAPVHLLLGIIRDSASLAAQVLTGSGITLEQARTLAPRGQRPMVEPAISEPTRQIISRAEAEARQLHHDYIGTEHMLLALAQQGDAAVMPVFTGSGVNGDQVRAAVMAVLNSPGSP